MLSTPEMSLCIFVWKISSDGARIGIQSVVGAVLDVFNPPIKGGNEHIVSAIFLWKLS